jgi:uncharacterized protein YcfL
MKKAILLTALLLAGCSTVNCNFTGDNNKVSIEQPKTISTSPALTASGNTVPIIP